MFEFEEEPRVDNSGRKKEEYDIELAVAMSLSDEIQSPYAVQAYVFEELRKM